MTNEKGITLIKLILIIAVVIIGLIFTFAGSKPGYELSVKDREEVAISELRLAIAKGALDGSGIMTKDDFNTLGKLVKNAKNSNQWFAGNKSILYGKTADTSDKQVTIVSDGTYTATFTTIEKKNGKKLSDKNIYLVDYTFEQQATQGYKFFVGN